MAFIHKLRSLKIALLSYYYTGLQSIKLIYLSLRGKSSRPKVDAILQQWSSQLLDLIQVQYSIINPSQTKPTPGKATIIMCNHSSHYDIPLSLKAFPNQSMRMLSKAELAKIPLMGQGMRAAEFPFVARQNRVQAIKDLEQVQALLESGILMWIAPEGTRSKNGRLGQFKKGGFVTAIKTKATIIPMGIRGGFELLPIGSWEPKLQQTIEIHIGEAIDASEYSLENKEALIERVHQSMLQLAGQSTSG